MLPTSVLYIPLYILVARLGLTNTLWGLVLIYPTFTLPYVAWILIPHVQSIPVALEEAAMMDGCSHFMIMYRIIFPLALPGIISTTIFAFAMCWGEYRPAAALAPRPPAPPPQPPMGRLLPLRRPVRRP